MKFSLFLEIPVASPTRERERQAIKNAIEQAVLADQLGYDCIWAVEHHGLYEYSHCSAPESVLSYIAAKTKNIRLGHGICLLPGKYNHPIRVAERVGMLDNLSDGRVNFGTGKSSTQVERQAFGIDPETVHAEWLTNMKMIVDMWGTDIYSCDNAFYKIPPTPIVPKPVQAPHPPMYAACGMPNSVKEAASMGLGALNFSAGTDEYLRDRIRDYRAGAEQPTNPIGRITKQFACTASAVTLANDLEACRHGMRGGRYFGQTLVHYFTPKARPIGPIKNVAREDLTAAELEAAMRRRNTPRSELMSVVGDATAARETIARFQATGLDELILVMEMGVVPHDITMQSVRYFAEQIMPHFK